MLLPHHVNQYLQIGQSHAFLQLLKRPVVHDLAAVYAAYIYATVRLVRSASPCNISSDTSLG